MHTFLHNAGSTPVGVKALQQQIDKGAIAFYDLSRGGLHILDEILVGGPRGAEYLFALSLAKGMRVFVKSALYRGIEIEEFHHQNIFQNNRDLIAAGTIHAYARQLIFTNMSGHYRPAVSCLAHVEAYLEKLGVPKKKCRVVEYTKLDALLQPPSQRFKRMFGQCFGSP
jgi:hypothetical protein